MLLKNGKSQQTNNLIHYSRPDNGIFVCDMYPNMKYYIFTKTINTDIKGCQGSFRE